MKRRNPIPRTSSAVQGHGGGDREGRDEQRRRNDARVFVRKRKREPSLVGELLVSARRTAAAAAGVNIDREAWRRLVGARIADCTEPGGIDRGVLLVYAASAVWVQELSLLSDEIIARLRRASFAVDAIRFRVKTTARRGVDRGRIAARPPAPLPEELRARLDLVDDPALRAIIAEAAGRSLALPDPPAAGRASTRKSPIAGGAGRPATPASTPSAAAQARGTTSTPPGARGPRSAAPRNDRPDRAEFAPRAASRRTRGGPAS